MAQTTRSVMSSRDALKNLGYFVVIISGIVQFLLGLQFINFLDNDKVSSYYTLAAISSIPIILSLFGFIDRLKDQDRPVLHIIATFGELVLASLLPILNMHLGWLISGIIIGYVGEFLVIIAVRPNYGPTGNKKIYQAVAGIMAFGISIAMLVLSIYVAAVLVPIETENSLIANFAGRGTFPGDFYYSFIEKVPANAGVETYEALRLSGILMGICAAMIMLLMTIRNKISLKLTSIIFFVLIIWASVNVIVFDQQWNRMDTLLYTTFPTIYSNTLALKDPGVTTAGGIMIALYSVSLLMMIYASRASKPIQSWRRRRDSAIAAAEVFFREGKLQSAVKYLERAAQLSSKIDEEDKAVEIITKIKSIKDKAIKMKKAEAAEKAKKQYEKQKKLEQAKAKQVVSSKKGKTPPKTKATKVKSKTPSKKDEDLEKKIKEAAKKKKK